MLDTISADTKVEEETLGEIDAELIVSSSPDEDTILQYVSTYLRA